MFCPNLDSNANINSSELPLQSNVRKLKLESYANRPHYDKFSITDRLQVENYLKTEIMERFRPTNPYDSVTHVIWLSPFSKRISNRNVSAKPKNLMTHSVENMGSNIASAEQFPKTKCMPMNDVSNVDLTSKSAANIIQEHLKIQTEFYQKIDIKREGNNYNTKIDGVRKYECLTCGKLFNQLWILRNHQLQHTGHRPYICPVLSCKASFSDRSNMRAHQRAKGHHEWKFKCQRCEKPFNQQRFLKTHKMEACNKYYLQRMLSRKPN